MDERIKRFINKTRIWVFCRNLTYKAIWCLLFGAGVGMVFEIVGYYVPWYYVHCFSVGAMLIALTVAVLVALIRFPSATKAAAELDKSGLEERAQTAVELLGQEGMFAELQKQDAYRAMLGEKIRKMIPIRMTWKRPLMCLLFIFLMITFGMLPSDAKGLAARQYEVAKSAKEEIAKVEEVKEELEEEISPEEMAEYQDTLKDIISEIKEAKTPEEIDKSLERAKTKLEQMSEKSKSEAAKDKMSQLAKALDADRNNKDSDSKNNSEMLAAAQDLEEMLSQIDDLEQLSQEELEELLEKINELEEVAASELSDSQLANLEELANQISSGQLNNNALASAKATVSGLKQTGQQVAQGNNPDSNGSGNGDGDGNGEGNGNGNGSGNGSGSGSGHGGGWNTGSSDGTESYDAFGGDMVSIPNETGDDDNLTGQATEGESFVSKGGQALTWSGRQVQYSSVFGQYRQQALSRIENGSYPSGVQDIIKSYFEKLSY